MSQSYTLIENLPELKDLDISGTNNSPLQEHNKYIRNPHQLSAEAGMAPMNAPVTNSPHPQHYPIYDMPNHMLISCIDIAKHIQECPVCSKFYQSDKSAYIIIIVILAVACLLLLKKVLNV